MQITLVVFPLLMLACISNAMPVEPDTVSSLEDVHVNSHQLTVEEESRELAEEDSLVRQRRSPFQPGGGGGFPQPRPTQPRGGVSGSVHRESGVGTVVRGQGQGNVWTSKDGNSRVDAQGQWSKVVNGPGKSKPNYNGGVTFEHRW